MRKLIFFAALALAGQTRADEMPIRCDQGGGLGARCWIPSVPVPTGNVGTEHPLALPGPSSVGGPVTEAYRKDLQDPDFKRVCAHDGDIRYTTDGAAATKDNGLLLKKGACVFVEPETEVRVWPESPGALGSFSIGSVTPTNLIAPTTPPSAAPCAPPSQLFYGCLPPTIYVPNPGHCESPPGNSQLPPAYVTAICGVPAIETKTKSEYIPPIQSGMGTLWIGNEDCDPGTLWVNGRCEKVLATGPMRIERNQPIHDGIMGTAYLGNQDTKWVGKVCKLNDPRDCWKCAPEEALACRAHVAAGEIYCAVEDDIIDGKCVKATVPARIERKPGDMTVDSQANPQGDPALYYWPECQVPYGQSPTCLDKKKAGCVLNGLDWDYDHKLCREPPAGGSGPVPGVSDSRRQGDMSVGNGLCYVMGGAGQWIPCERFLQGIFGSWSSPRCPPDYAILEVPGTTFLVCARDLQVPKSW